MKHFLRHYKFLILLIVVLLSNSSAAQSGNDILSQLQNKFNTIKSFTADFTQQVTDADNNIVFNSTGKINFAQVEKLNIDFGSRIIISNGKDVWNIDKAMERVVITDANERSNSFSIKTFIFDIPQRCSIKVIQHNGANSIIEMIPQTDLGFSSSKLTITNDWLIAKLEINDNLKNKIVFELSNYKINNNLSNEIFEYKVQKGFEVIDLR